jgi:DmsE family decaheme c-type cytochrome
MNNKKLFLGAALFLTGMLFSVTVFSEEPATPAAAPAEVPVQPTGYLASQYTEKGADTCIKCHDEESEFPVFSIFKTKHTQKADKRTPFAGQQCEACHGPGAEHAKKVPEGQKQAPIISFSAKSAVPHEKQNKICLECHQGNDRVGWSASKHEGGNLTCVSCHKVHAPRDAVLAKSTQPEVCYSCHKKERAEFFKPSTHPVRSGQMACSECHNPHGTNTTALLTKPTVNQTCYTCHAEKRGPFLWEHAPVSEDCTTCHTPHGSVHRALLIKSTPLLCQQCHSPAGHPSVARTGAALPGGGAGTSGFLLAGSCTNCHSQVHGSNHPSGSRLMR